LKVIKDKKIFIIYYQENVFIYKFTVLFMLTDFYWTLEISLKKKWKKENPNNCLLIETDKAKEKRSKVFLS